MLQSSSRSGCMRWVCKVHSIHINLWNNCVQDNIANQGCRHELKFGGGGLVLRGTQHVKRATSLSILSCEITGCKQRAAIHQNFNVRFRVRNIDLPCLLLAQSFGDLCTLTIMLCGSNISSCHHLVRGDCCSGPYPGWQLCLPGHWYCQQPGRCCRPLRRWGCEGKHWWCVTTVHPDCVILCTLAVQRSVQQRNVTLKAVLTTHKHWYGNPPQNNWLTGLIPKPLLWSGNS